LTKAKVDFVLFGLLLFLFCCFGFALFSVIDMVMASLDCVLVLLQHAPCGPSSHQDWMNSNATITANMLHANIACGIDLVKAERRRKEGQLVGSMKGLSPCGQLKFLKDCRTEWVHAIQLFNSLPILATFDLLDTCFGSVSKLSRHGQASSIHSELISKGGVKISLLE